MANEFHSSIVAPTGIWWKPAHKQEKRWIIIAFVWCLVLFAMMPLWHLRGGQNPSGIRHRVEPAAFSARTLEFIREYQVGTDRGMPVVAPPQAGSRESSGLRAISPNQPLLREA